MDNNSFYLRKRYKRNQNDQQIQEQPNQSENQTLPGLKLPTMSRSPKRFQKKRRARSNQSKYINSLNTTEQSNLHSLLDERTRNIKKRETGSRDHYKYAVNRRSQEARKRRRSASNIRLGKILQRKQMNNVRASHDPKEELKNSSLGKRILEAKKEEALRRSSLKVKRLVQALGDDEKIALKFFKKYKGKVFDNLSEEVKNKVKVICAKFVIQEHTMTKERFSLFCKLIVDGVFQSIWMKQNELLYKPTELNITFPRKRKIFIQCLKFTLKFFFNFF